MGKHWIDIQQVQIESMAIGDNIPILRKDSDDTEWTTAKGFLIVFMGIMNIFMFLGNTLSIVTICYNSKLRRQVSYWFVMNLAVIDFLISVTVVPLNIVWEYYGTWPFSHITCEFFTFADIAFSTISAYSIVLVSIDKYMYIAYSIQYFDKMTRKLAVILIITVWIFVLIFTTISILTEVGTSENYKDHFLTPQNKTNTCIFVMTDTYVIPSAVISFFLPFGILCFTSSRIVCIASKHIRKIHTICNSITSETDSEIHKMSRAKGKTNNATITVNDSSQTRVNNLIPEINIIPPVSTNCQDESANNNSDINTAALTNLHKNSSVTIKEETSTNGHVNKAIFMTNGSGKIIASLENDGQTNTEVNTSNDAIKESVLKPRSKSLRSFSVKKTESLRSINLKRTESLRSSSVRRKRSPYCKLFGTVTIVIACFILMFAPYNVAIVADVWCHCINPWVYEDILAVLYYMHSLVNPYIYMATDRKYKAGLRYLWKKVSSLTICCKRNTM